MIIERCLKSQIIKRVGDNKNKIILLYGPRQVGKTTLIKEIIAEVSLKTLQVNADEAKYNDVLSSRDLKQLDGLTAGYDLLFIDEAQRIPNIGINLKILHDQRPNLKIIATGSSSFELAQTIAEPLTGRTWTYKLYPISFQELKQSHNSFELDQQKEERMIYGSYPEIFSFKNNEDKQKYLEELSTSYLYKDILELSSIKNSVNVRRLLQLLSYQIGQEVSLTEIGQKLELSKNTVINYIDLLEKSFVLMRLSGLSRNLRKEVTQKDKIYFTDLGVRNILIDNLKPLKERNDVGQLWENFLMIERYKKNIYTNKYFNQYFWRTYTGAEIDYVEDYDGILHGYEYKYNEKRVTAPASWKETYPESTFETINKANYLSFITTEE
jgi:predicted AAA+ superfamily ATPase